MTPLPPQVWVPLGLAHLAGLLTGGVVLFRGRTPQGTTAWIIALLAIPALAVPAYWLFGRPFFQGYGTARGQRRLARARRTSPPERLTGLPRTTGNAVHILKDGDETFASLFDGLARARTSVVVQFYIVRNDATGHAFRDALLAARARGVRVYLLMDWVGCQGLTRAFDRELRKGGVHVQRFKSSWGRVVRFQFNFRNHRKIMVVDGVEGWMGGLNVGDDYRGRGRDGRPWRDTHFHLRGPAARDLQHTFVGDWFWTTGTEPEGLRWGEPDDEPSVLPPFGAEDQGEGASVTVVPSGPSDRISAASLTLLDAIHRARTRLWMTTAYFVPDAPLMAALQLAALRGVDVRILVPRRGDLAHMDRVSFAFFGDLLRVGVRIFRYTNGVLHAKTAVVDDALAVVGTANLDPRSLYLNFEVTMLLHSAEVTEELARQMEEDLSKASPLTAEDLEARSFSDRLLTRFLYLFSPAL